MTDRTERLEVLRKIADAATPGPWISTFYPQEQSYRVHVKGHPELAVCRTYGDSLAACDNARRIAAFDPAVTTALVDVAVAARVLHKLTSELCTSVDNAVEDIGGSRGALTILREIGPADDILRDALAALSAALEKDNG